MIDRVLNYGADSYKNQVHPHRRVQFGFDGIHRDEVKYICLKNVCWLEKNKGLQRSLQRSNITFGQA